jgi:sugar/nucleoside kinase (ribokinase family)
MSGLGITKQDVLDSLQYTDVFAPCHEGMIDLTGTEDPEKCRDYLRKYCSGILIFTQGSKGSMAFDENNRRIQVPAEKITPVDTTGAGDSYIGGFMFSYFLRHDSLEEAMKFATVCAAHTCGKLGARASGTLAEVSNEQ